MLGRIAFMDRNLSPKNSSKTAQPSEDAASGMVSVLAWMSDAQGRCIHVTPDATAYFALGQSIEKAAWNAWIHPEDGTRFANLACAKRARRQAYQLEYRVFTAQGGTRWKLEAAAPRFSETGEFLGYNASIADITALQLECELLIEKEAAHRFLLENSIDIITHLDSGGIVRYVTPSVFQTLGYTPSEIIGSCVFDHIHPEDSRFIRKRLASELKARDAGMRFEFRKRHKNGHYVWMSSAINVLTANDAIVGIVAVCRDASFERQAKDELRQREERFRNLANLSSDWYWETDALGRFSFVSDSVERVFGIPARKLLGKVCIDFAIEKDKPELEVYFSTIARQEPFRDIRYSAYVRSRDAICHASISGEPIFENDNFKGYRGVGRDITQEINAAQELAALAAENKALIEDSLDMMILFNQDGSIVRINRALLETLGYTEEELIGRCYLEVVHPEDHEAVSAVDAGLRTGKNVIHDFEIRCLRKDGKVLHTAWAARWMDDRKLTYATGRDVNERYITQAELQKSKDQLSTMLESIGDAFFALDNEWRVTYVNNRTADFVGRKKEDLIGKLAWEAVPEFQSSSDLPNYQKAMATREKVFFEGYWEPNQSRSEVRIYPSEDGLAVFFHDITQRRESENAVRDSEQRLREVIEMTPAGYAVVDADSIIRDVNLALCKMSGYAREELVGARYTKLFSSFPSSDTLFDQGTVNWVHGREGAFRHKDGHIAHVLINANVKRDCHGNALAVTAFMTEITERKQTEQRLHQLANHDILTGLPNRTFLNVRLQEILDNARPHECMAVMFIDLDRFKEVNDTMGHDPGDMLLREVASRLQSIMRPNDIVARLGGDEFIIVANCSHGRAAAAIIADKLLAALKSPFMIEGQEVFVTASVGISLFPYDGDSKEMLFKNADMAMYSAKAAGRNNFRFFEAEMSKAASVRMKLENSLHHALERNEFELHYQPRIDLNTMQVVGLETLIRWNHPELGRVPPLQFIPIAEESGMIEAIGHWVLQQSCRELRRLIDKTGRQLRLSVNVSARQLKSSMLVGQVRDILREADLPGHALELELTETALMEDMDISAAILRDLKAQGVMLAVDDFGTGYSGLAYLQRFPLDVLKLDRTFVNENAENAKNIKFIEAFLDLAHALNLSVVAEGIETLDILNCLRELACDEGQGYLFARPMPADELERFLMKPAFGEH
jgi:diguanylate cyclase (GGDEF)-like protein/PAS domain S-box-containing protein